MRHAALEHVAQILSPAETLPVVPFCVCVCVCQSKTTFVLGRLLRLSLSWCD